MFLPSTITLQSGDSGDFVAELQRRLVAVECFNAEGINGFFDGPTYNGVFAFQSRHGIRADGIAGPETLRRLNGVISGDTSTTSDKKEEEKAQATGPSVFQQEMIAEQHAPEPVYTFTLPPKPEPTPAAPAAEAVIAPPPPIVPPPAPAPLEPTIAQQQMLRDQMQAQAHQQQPTGLSAAEMLETALARAAQHQPAQRPPLEPQAQQPHAQHPAPEARPAPSPAPIAAKPPAPEPVPQQAVPEQPRGLMGRAMQYANEMVQKLATHFEAKLPPSVLAEVHKIGQVMARSGMAETPIPQEPTQARGAELPGRGQEQGRQRS